MKLISATKTETGLEVHAWPDTNEYATKKEVSEEELNEVNILRNDFHGEWNYEIRPKTKTSVVNCFAMPKSAVTASRVAALRVASRFAPTCSTSSARLVCQHEVSLLRCQNPIGVINLVSSGTFEG